MSRAVLSVLQNGSTAWKGSEFIQKEVYIMYAIIKTGGKQYKVQEGDVVYVEKLGMEDGAAVSFDEVIAVGDGAELKIGAPTVEGASVEGRVIKTGKKKKVLVFKYNSKKNYRRRQGHRQPYTKVQIEKIKA